MGCAVSSAATINPEDGHTKFVGVKSLDAHTNANAADGASLSPAKPRQSRDSTSTSVSAVAAENIVASANFGRFTDRYAIGGVLGVGSFATVRLCSNHAGEQFAVKIVKLSGQASMRVLANRMNVGRSDSAWRNRTSGRSSKGDEKEDLAASDKHGDLKYLWREIETMKDVNHPSIIKLHGVYLSSTAQRVYLVLQYLPGGELLGILQRRERFSEEETHQVMVPLLKALEYLHARGIVHRDIKLENLMLEDPLDLSSVKLCDFGLAKLSAADSTSDEWSVRPRQEVMATLCGTRVYMPPELVQRQQGACAPPADVWSAGIAFFTMLTGRLPFSPAKDQDGTYDRIWKSILGWNPRKVVETSPLWAHASLEAKDLLVRMTEALPRKRCTASEALADPWVVRKHHPGPPGAAAAAAAASEPAAAAEPRHGPGAPACGAVYGLSPCLDPRLDSALRTLQEFARGRGRAPTLFTRGDLLASPLLPGLAAAAGEEGGASSAEGRVLLVTRGELEVVEGVYAQDGAFDDSVTFAAPPLAEGGSRGRGSTTTISTRVECAAPGLVIGRPEAVLCRSPLLAAARLLPAADSRDSAGTSGGGTDQHISSDLTSGRPSSERAAPAQASRPPAGADSPPCAALVNAPRRPQGPSVPVSVRVRSASAEAIVLPAELFRSLLDEARGLVQVLRSEAGARFDGKSLVLLGAGREQQFAASVSAMAP